MNFEVWDIWILASVVGIAVVGFAVFKLRKPEGKVSKSTGKQFLTIGIIWLLFGLAYSIWRDTNLFNIALFNLGLIFTIAGIAQIVVERFKKRGL